MKLQSALGIAYLVSAIASFINGSPMPSGFHKIDSYLQFGSATHTGLTYGMLLCIPGFQNWTHEKMRSQFFNLKFLLVISFFLFLLISFYFLNIFSGPNDFLIPKMLLEIFWVSYPIYHAMRQVYGIVVMNHQQESISHQSRSREKKAFDFFSISIVLQAILVVLSRHTLIEKSAYKSMSLVLGGFFFCLVTAIIVCSNLRSWRSLFLFRLFLYPLAFHSTVAGLGIIATHGYEYFSVSGEIFRRSSVKVKSNSKSKFAIFVVLILTSLFALSPRYGLVGLMNLMTLPLANWRREIEVATGFCAFTHYYLDSILFKMKDPLSRTFIGPLLVSQS